MRNKFLGVSAAVAALLLSAPAFAQDEGSSSSGADSNAGSWTGPYVGGSLGYSWQPNYGRDRNETMVFDTDGDGNFNNGVSTVATTDAFAPGFCRGVANGATRADGCRGDNDGRVGWSLHAGYDMQMGNFLVGGVIEGGQAYVSNSVSGFSTTPASYTLTRRLDWNGAARLRAGFILPSNTLLYGTGGLAYGKFKNSFATTNTFNTFTETDRKEDDWGWTVGGGIEQKVSDQFSIGVLYKYTRFTPNDYRVTAGQGTPASLTNPFVITPAGETVIGRSNDRFEVQDVRVTASFRF